MRGTKPLLNIVSYCHVCSYLQYDFLFFLKMPSTCKKCGSPNIIVRFIGSVYPPGHSRKYSIKFGVFILVLFLTLVLTFVPIHVFFVISGLSPVLVTFRFEEMIAIIFGGIIDCSILILFDYYYVEKPKLREIGQYLTAIIQRNLPKDISTLSYLDEIQDPLVTKRVKNPEKLPLKYVQLIVQESKDNCPQCDALVLKGAKFCTKCGKDLRNF